MVNEKRVEIGTFSTKLKVVNESDIILVYQAGTNATYVISGDHYGM